MILDKQRTSNNLVAQSKAMKRQRTYRPVNERRGFVQCFRQRFDVTSFDLEISLKVTHQPLVAAGQRLAEQTKRVGQLVGDNVLY